MPGQPEPQETRSPGGPSEARRPTGGSLVTILFTDLASSTELTSKLGDAGAQELLRTHNTIVRTALSAHGGTEVKHTGDGIMASFPTASGALECTIAILRAVRAHVTDRPEQALSVHMGLNAGEPLAEDQDLFGTAVQLCRRICDAARGDEVLVSDVVRQLAAGKGFSFINRGTPPLKGFSEPRQLWELRWREDVPARLDGTIDSLAARKARGAWVGPHGWRNHPRRVMVAAAALAASAVFVVGLAVIITAGGSSGGTEDPAYKTLVTTEAVRSNVQNVSGDCQSQDLVVRGTSKGTVEGDLQGSSSGTFSATLTAADDCLRAHAVTTQTITDESGNTLTIDGDSFALSRGSGLIEGQPASSQNDRAFGVITGGTGVYRGAYGAFVCDVLTVISSAGSDAPTSTARTNAECEYSLLTTGEKPPLILQFGVGEQTVSVLGGPSERPVIFPLVLVCLNSSEVTLRGLVMRLGIPPGANVHLRDQTNGEFAPPSSVSIPDLSPGEIVRVVLAAQVVSTSSSTVEFSAVVEGAGLERPLESNRVSVQVVD